MGVGNTVLAVGEVHQGQSAALRSRSSWHIYKTGIKQPCGAGMRDISGFEATLWPHSLRDSCAPGS